MRNAKHEDTTMPDPLPTTEELQRTLEICEQAPSGPLDFSVYDDRSEAMESYASGAKYENSMGRYVEAHTFASRDCEFMETARTALPLYASSLLRLMDELAALRAERDRLRKFAENCAYDLHDRVSGGAKLAARAALAPATPETRKETP
jgi:hypothetical protein